MRTAIRIGIVIVFVLFTISLAHAQYSGHDLIKGWEASKRCNENRGTTSDYNDTFFYFGYVSAAFDIGCPFSGFCQLPAGGVTRWQIAAVVGKYLEAHPEQWSLAASALVMLALKNGFPKSQ
jgi:hypothetical protein